MLIALGLGDPNSFVEVIIGQLGIEDGVAVARQECRLDALGKGLQAVEEEGGLAMKCIGDNARYVLSAAIPFGPSRLSSSGVGGTSSILCQSINS